MQDDYQALRRFTGAAVLIVAAIAATVSYLHIYRLAVELGQPQLAAWLMPLSVDGAVGAASVALLSAARSDQRSPWTARIMLALGVAATLSANGYSGSAHGIAGVALAMWPGVAFIGSTETALSMTRRSAEAATVESASIPTVETDSTPARPPLSVAFPRVAEPAAVESGSTMKAAPGMRTPSASHKRTRPASVTVESAALRYAPELAAGRIPSMRRVRADLSVGQARAQQIVAHLKSLSLEGIAA